MGRNSGIDDRAVRSSPGFRSRRTAATYISTPDERPVMEVRGIMTRERDEEIKKLPVEEDLEIVGIATMTDVARSRPEAVGEAADPGRDGEAIE